MQKIAFSSTASNLSAEKKKILSTLSSLKTGQAILWGSNDPAYKSAMGSPAPIRVWAPQPGKGKDNYLEIKMLYNKPLRTDRLYPLQPVGSLKKILDNITKEMEAQEAPMLFEQGDLKSILKKAMVLSKASGDVFDFYKKCQEALPGALVDI